ncbi:hypothetical protein C4569_00840 [Candidatus Parcubacteria bacterium]|nr:MAG: hypothetical protein C4569_00840 [Candidatus Parcubacteria bacterium]
MATIDEIKKRLNLPPDFELRLLCLREEIYFELRYWGKNFRAIPDSRGETPNDSRRFAMVCLLEDSEDSSLAEQLQEHLSEYQKKLNGITHQPATTP